MFKLNSKVTFREIEDSILIITPWNNSLHTLENVGKDIFKLLLHKKSIEEIADIITSDYEVKKEIALKDINELIINLQQNEIFTKEV